MRKLRFTAQAVALSAFVLALASLAQAQATRTWVSGVGDDVNPCSRTAPCKTWAGAISKTAAGGEIDALDPGGFGAVTITKSITIDGAGTNASILHSGTNGVIVNDSATATPNTIKVVLRNLSINGAGTTLGLNGIRYLSGASLIVENTRIMNASTSCIDVNKTNAGEVQIVNSVLSSCGTSGINHNAGAVLTQINGTSILDSTTGITNVGGRVNVSNSVISGHNGNGMAATTGAARINATGNVISNNSLSGVRAEVGSVVTVSNNDIFGNATGLSNSGTMETFRNNRLRNNTTQVSGALTDVSPVNTGIF
jgi:hypothetical protein